MSEAHKWGKWTGADAGTIKDIAKTAETLAEQVQTTSVLAQTAMTVVKWIAELQSVNPVFKALDTLADEILKAVQDIKSAGYYYLIVDPYSPKKNVEPYVNPAGALGFEVIRDESGRELYWDPNNADPESTTTANPPMNSPYEFKFVTPRKLVAGGRNPYTNSPVDPFSIMTPFPVYNAKTVINTMCQAFQDEGDVPKYQTSISPGAPYPKLGDNVFNDDGDIVSGFDPEPKYGQQLWDAGKMKPDGSPHTSSAMTDGKWKNQRRKINHQVTVGRPFIQGATLNLSDLSTLKEDVEIHSSCMVFIIGATSYKHFVESFNAFSKLWSDVDELQAGMTESIMKAYEAFTKPATQVINLTMCDSKYGLFEPGDVIRGYNYGGLGKITSINSLATSNTSMVSTVRVLQTDDIGITKARMAERDMNSDGRYQDMEVTIIPIPTKEKKGVEDWTPNDSVYEQEVRGTWGKGEETFPNYMTKGVAAMNEARALAHSSEEAAKQATAPSKRIYPKYGTVAMQRLEHPKESTAPDFKGIQIGQMIPGWTEVFEKIEGYIGVVKSYIATSADFIQDMIDALNELIEYLENLIKAIQAFLKFFEVDLSSSGIYSLYISSESGGTEGLVSKIQSAEGLPNNLDYSAGILFVGIGSYNDLLGPIFDPKQGWK